MKIVITGKTAEDSQFTTERVVAMAKKTDTIVVETVQANKFTTKQQIEGKIRDIAAVEETAFDRGMLAALQWVLKLID